MSEGTVESVAKLVIRQENVYMDEDTGEVCIGNMLVALSYTAVTFLTIVFFVLGRQIIHGNMKEYERSKEEYISIQQLAELTAREVDLEDDEEGEGESTPELGSSSKVHHDQDTV